MHDEARDFMTFVASKFPEFFGTGTRVLDAGSADINGNNRYLFGDNVPEVYVANDVLPGENVTIVCPTGNLDFEDGYFDVVISTECFEHDARWEESIFNMVRMLRDGGLIAFTCASTGRAEHGTPRTTRDESLTAQLEESELSTYYKNLTADDMRPVIWKTGASGSFFYNPNSKDLYFAGKKKAFSDIDYSNDGTVRC